MNNPNILLVVLDSVSASRLSCYGYDRPTTPQIDEFADRSTVYTNVVANGSWTVPTHGTLFTGRHPSEHGAHANHKRLSVDPERTLAGRLSEAGYRTVGLSTNPWVATDFDYDTGFDEFVDVHIPLPLDSASPRELFQHLNDGEFRGMGTYLEAAKWALRGNPIARTINTIYYRRHRESYASADVLNDQVEDWLREHDERPFFMFLNYMDAHEPYDPSHEYLSKFRDGDCTAEIEWHLRSIDERYDDAEVECINDRYDACLNLLDDRIGGLLELLEREGELDDTMIVLTSDHGKCLGEHGYMGVGTFLYEELLEIPLIVSRPDETGPDEETTLMTQIDIHDMILDAADAAEPTGRGEWVVSETLGPHQDVEVRTRQLPEKGLRRVALPDGSMTRDIATDEILDRELSAEERSLLGEAEREFLDNREPVAEHGGETEMRAGVKNQLEQLGYL